MMQASLEPGVATGGWWRDLPGRHFEGGGKITSQVISESERRVWDFSRTMTSENNLQYLSDLMGRIFLCTWEVELVRNKLRRGSQVNLRNVAEKVHSLLLPMLIEAREEPDGIFILLSPLIVPKSSNWICRSSLKGKNQI